MVNRDASDDWVDTFRDEHNIHMPFMRNADDAFEDYRLGREYRTVEPLFIVIDKNGIIRHRSFDKGSVSIEEIRDLIEGMVGE